MTFTEWYAENKGEEWHPDYAELCGYAIEMEEEFSEYCHENDLEPIWNG